MENNGKGKVVAIIILIVMVLGLGGYICYSKFVEEPKKESDHKKAVQKLEMKVNDKENTKESDEKIDVSGYYSFVEEENDVEPYGKYIYLGLFKNNAAVLLDLTLTPTRLFGGYEVKDNKIIFNYKWVDGEQRSPSYEGLKNFTFKNNKTLILEEGFGEKNIELKKITKDEYYNAIKKATIPISTTVTD